MVVMITENTNLKNMTLIKYFPDVLIHFANQHIYRDYSNLANVFIMRHSHSWDWLVVLYELECCLYYYNIEFESCIYFLSLLLLLIHSPVQINTSYQSIIATLSINPCYSMLCNYCHSVSELNDRAKWDRLKHSALTWDLVRLAQHSLDDNLTLK